uniref:Beta-1,4-N-acetylgalactosaminyltransferase n=1 Tax=Brugia timori TaxID=42155 RepID=A0A0R3Q5L6_9BILA
LGFLRYSRISVCIMEIVPTSMASKCASLSFEGVYLLLWSILVMIVVLNACSIFKEKNIQWLVFLTKVNVKCCLVVLKKVVWKGGSVKKPLTWVCIICVALFVMFIIKSWKNYIISFSTGKHASLTTIIPTHMLCVLVPYRDREAELRIFVSYIADFLNKQNVLHKIIVLNQTDALRFNRASLINVGWYEADRVGCDYLAMHDVDLLPLNPQLDYSYPGKGIIRHISSPEYHPKYNYTKFVGGILLLTMSDYKVVNGMSNKYWGWGLEDDEFYLRLRCKFAMAHKRDRTSGLNSVKYHIVGRNLLNFRKKLVVSVLNIELECDLKWTNYCRP